MIALNKSTGDTQNSSNIHAHRHGCDGKAIVIFLKVLGTNVINANVHVVLLEDIAIMKNPFEHFLAILLEETQLKALIEFGFLLLPKEEELLLCITRGL